MKKMIVIEQNEHYTLSGKTCLSISGGKDNGWFVGMIKTKKRLYFFATNVEPKAGFDMEMFPEIRKETNFKALQQMRIID